MNSLKLIILFGSHATGTAGTISDTDIAVLGDRLLTIDERSKLEEEYEVNIYVPESCPSPAVYKEEYQYRI